MSNSIYSRLCPNCQKSIVYTQKHNWKSAEEANTPCRKCAGELRKLPKIYVRNCPKCGKEIHHKCSKWCKKAIREGMLCKNCASSINMKDVANRPEVKAKLSKLRSEIYKGEGNPFHGKHHSDVTKSKIRNEITGRKLTDEQRVKSARKGKENGMYRKSVFSVWVEKYGLDEAKSRRFEMLRKKEGTTTGEKNGMYGKSPPVGAGWGWGGWYNDWYFRSLTELCYAIYLDANFIDWVGAESISIPYIGFINNNRTCRADFFIQGKRLVEIKPKGLELSKEARRKCKSISSFAKENGLEFELIRYHPIPFKDLIELVDCGKVKLVPRWAFRLEKIKCKLKKN